MRYKIFPHTADLRLKIYGRDYEEIFKNATLGLAKILDKGAEKKEKFARGAEKFSVSGKNWEMLLVNFLNEILSLSNINKKIYIKVKILNLSSNRLEARAAGLPVNKFDKDVKAISHHGLEIRKNRQNILKAVLTLDI